MSKTFRKSLLATTIIAGVSIAAPAFAQDVTPAPAEEAATGSDIVVTGSLIRNPNLERSAPVNVTSADEIELHQSNVAEEILREIPGVVPSIGSAVNNGNGGASFVNLRGLGSNRNIVLLDGNRIVPAELARPRRSEQHSAGAGRARRRPDRRRVDHLRCRRHLRRRQLHHQAGLRGRRSFSCRSRSPKRVTATSSAPTSPSARTSTMVAATRCSASAIRKRTRSIQGARDVLARSTSTPSRAPRVGSGTAVPSRFSARVCTGGRSPVHRRTSAARLRSIRRPAQIVPTFSTFNFNPFNIFQTPFERFNIYGAGQL